MLGFGSGLSRKDKKALKAALREYQSAPSEVFALVRFEMNVDSSKSQVAIESFWDDDVDPDQRPAWAALAYFGYVTKQAWNFDPEGNQYLDFLGQDSLPTSLATVASIGEVTSRFCAEIHLNLANDSIYPQTPSEGDDEIAAQLAAELTINLRDFIAGSGLVDRDTLDAGLAALIRHRDDAGYDPSDLASALDAMFHVYRVLVSLRLLPSLEEE